jgi:hypothetical protein
VLNARYCASAAQRAARSDPSLGKKRRLRMTTLFLKRRASDDGVFLDQGQRSRARSPALDNFDETRRGLWLRFFLANLFG